MKKWIGGALHNGIIITLRACLSPLIPQSPKAQSWLWCSPWDCLAATELFLDTSPSSVEHFINLLKDAIVVHWFCLSPGFPGRVVVDFWGECGMGQTQRPVWGPHTAPLPEARELVWNRVSHSGPHCVPNSPKPSMESWCIRQSGRQREAKLPNFLSLL